MFEQFELPDELAALEQELSKSRPTTSLLNRDELLYRAGYEAARSELLGNSPRKSSAKTNNHIWMVASGVFATLSAALALMLVWPSTEIESQPVASLTEAVAEPPQTLETEGALELEARADSPEAKPTRRRSGARYRVPAVWTANQSPCRLRQRPGNYDWSAVAVNRSKSSSRSPETSNRALLNEYLNDDFSQPSKNELNKTPGNEQLLQGENS